MHMQCKKMHVHGSQFIVRYKLLGCAKNGKKIGLSDKKKIRIP